jgi:hypothetical protein
MRISYKYIVLAIIVFIIVYNLRQSENFDTTNINTKIIFNTDEYLKNLTEEQAINMIVSSQVLPWVKLTETKSAEEIYNKLFNEFDDDNKIVKDIIMEYLDAPIDTNVASLTDEEKTILYNDILKNLKLTKTDVADTNISGNEIEEYGILLGFTKTMRMVH